MTPEQEELVDGLREHLWQHIREIRPTIEQEVEMIELLVELIDVDLQRLYAQRDKR